MNVFKITSQIFVLLAVVMLLGRTYQNANNTDSSILISLLAAGVFWVIYHFSLPQQKKIEINRDLFYSAKEKTLFWVAGYTDNSANVVELTAIFLDRALALANLAQVDVKKINSLNIEKSRRYKRMRVFYVKTEIIPEKAFQIGENWDMWEWLED